MERGSAATTTVSGVQSPVAWPAMLPNTPTDYCGSLHPTYHLWCLLGRSHDNDHQADVVLDSGLTEIRWKVDLGRLTNDDLFDRLRDQ